MPDTLFAPTEEGRGFYKDRGSKFWAYAYPCENKEQGDGYLQALKKEYHDARHHCYAYRIGKRGEISFANDDGEPAHSAGDPILAAIRSESLTNVWVVVIRYFGGTKLGVRGLIEAYRRAASEALVDLPRMEMVEQVSFSITYRYDQTAEIERILHPYSYKQIEAQYHSHVYQVIAIKKENFPSLRDQLESAQHSLKILSED